MFHYAPTFQPLQDSLSSFYLPSPTLSNPTPPQTGSDLLSRRTAGTLGIFVPPLSSAGGASSDEDQYGALSPVYSDLPASVHVAFIVALGANDGHILSLRLLPAETLGSDVGPMSLGWRLTWPQMAANLVLHLLEVAEFSSVGLPAFEPLLAKLPLYRSEIQDLSPASKIPVTVLCVLGARATSHSELFGVVGVDVVDPVCSSELASLIGRRREEVCQNLVELALDLCDDHSVAIDACTLESLAALVQLFTVEEAWEGQHRHILHLAHTLYVERLHACTTVDEVNILKLQAGVALFEHDCISSSTANRRCEITQVTDYIDSLIQLPSLSAPLSLPYYADPPHSHPLTSNDHADSFLAAICWVGGLQRMFSEILEQPHHPQQADPVLHLIPALWDQVDHVRTTIQRRQRALHELADAGADAVAIEGQVFAGMRADLRVVELLMVVHGFLLGLRGRSREMRGLVELSELRMRKCLKLLSYCAKVYLASAKGRPLLYHLVVQLELLPNWTFLVVQRVGEAGGPREKEYEVSEQELDWLTSAMRVAEFYTPLASERLKQLILTRRILSPPLSPSSRLNPVPLKTIQEISFYPSPPLPTKPLAFDLSAYLASPVETGFRSQGVEAQWEEEREGSGYVGEEFEQGGEWMEQEVGGFGERV